MRWLVVLLLLVVLVAPAGAALQGYVIRTTCTSISSPTTNGIVCFETSTVTFKTWNGSAWVAISGSGSGTVSGTTNKIAKFTAPTTAGDSLLSDDGTTLTYTGTGGASAPKVTTTGTAGAINVTAITAPSTPSAGTAEVYVDSTSKNLCTKNDAGTVLCGVTAALKQYKCVVIVGDPGASSSTLANDNDSPVACTNDTGQDVTITGFACYADAGTPTVTPILTGGSGTSIVTGAVTCGTASWAAGTINGTPTLHSFTIGSPATCSSTPCTADMNITAAGGSARYIVFKLTGTVPNN